MTLPLALAEAAAAVQRSEEARNFDGRTVENADFEAAPTAAQLEAVEALRAELPDLLVSFDPATGVTRSVWNAVGFLTGDDPAGPGGSAPGTGSPLDDLLTGRNPGAADPDSGGSDSGGSLPGMAGGGVSAGPPAPAVALETGLGFVRDHLDLFGLTAADLEDYEITDSVASRVGSSTHLYLRQLYREIPVYNGQLQLNVGRGGRLLSVNNAFVPSLETAVNTTEPGLSAAQAVEGAARHLGIDLRLGPGAADLPRGPRQETTVQAKGFSREPVEASLAWLPIRRDDVRLVWNFQVHTQDRAHIYDLTVDGLTGEVWTRIDWVASADSYQVYPQPVESPIHTTPAPPADARVIVTAPADAAASPFQWHDTNGFPGAEFFVPRGNNVHAFDDLNGDGLPPAVEPSGGLLNDYIFPIDLTMDPVNYTSASVTNLFYWNNIIHDVQYRYGFDEVAGNFQVTHYPPAPPAGSGDPVLAHAQDGICINNAFFASTPDGISPTMFMCLWNLTAPRLDGSLESSIIVHEYGHGISNRLVGGPGNVSCLGNAQQPGEGLSDWWALAYTALPTDTGPQARGIGTYVLGQPPNGPGIRILPYSTDNTVNPWTYSNVAGMPIPHGVGSVWAQGAWEVYWALVGQHGFDADLYDAFGGSGNQRMMIYVNEGLKNTACSPAFTDVRDGIIQAAVNNYGGEDVCRVWRAFANFGLGTDAISGGPGGTTPTDGFQVPGSCQLTPQVVQTPFTNGSASFASCPAGTRGAGGGCLENGLAVNLFAGEPTFPNFGIEGFLCVHDAVAPNLSAYAVCVNDPGSIGYVQVQQTTAGGTGVFAPCPAGKTVIGGGCSDDTFANDRVSSSFPITTPVFGAEGWICLYNTNSGGSLTAHATCIDTPQVVGLQVVQQNTTTSNVSLASCPASHLALGGGCWDNTFTSNLRATIPLTSPPFGAEGWACGFSASTGNLTSFALCLAP